VDIRPRETRHGGKSVSVLEAWGQGEEPGPPAEPDGGLDRDAAPELAGPEEPWEPEEVAEPPRARARALEREDEDGPAAAEAHAPPGVPAAPPRATSVADVPAVQDLRALYRRVLQQALDAVPEANLAGAQRIVEGRAPTLRGLALEFPGAPEVDELERLHRAALARLRKEREERRRRQRSMGALWDRLRGGGEGP
jgi:hypothetical protein